MKLLSEVKRSPRPIGGSFLIKRSLYKLACPLSNPPLTHIIRYTVAFVDYFDEEVEERNGDWEKVLEEYLYSSPEPLINGYIGGRMFLLARVIVRWKC